MLFCPAAIFIDNYIKDTIMTAMNIQSGIHRPAIEHPRFANSPPNQYRTKKNVLKQTQFPTSNCTAVSYSDFSPVSENDNYEFI
jgi:hypothetical protein